MLLAPPVFTVVASAFPRHVTVAVLTTVLSLAAGEHAFAQDIVIKHGRLFYDGDTVRVEIRGDDGLLITGSGSASQINFGPDITCSFCTVGMAVSLNSFLCCSDFGGTVVVNGVTYKANGLSDSTQFSLVFSGDPVTAPAPFPAGQAKVRAPITMSGTLRYEATPGQLVTLEFVAVTGDAVLEFQPGATTEPDIVSVSSAVYRFRSDVHGGQ